MSRSDHKSEPEIAEAAWAHNRWPAIGLYTGAGTGLVVGVVTYVGLLWTVIYMIGLAAIGCVGGFLVARITYGGPSRTAVEIEDDADEEGAPRD